MLLFWRIRYLDSRDKQFKDRDLWLDTATLEPVTRAAIEATDELRHPGLGREMLRYRHLFREQRFGEDDPNDLVHRYGGMSGVFIPEYFEDEQGCELNYKQIAVILTGNPDANMFPSGAKQHDIAYALADQRAIPIDKITLSPEAVNILGIFARDLRELLNSALFRDGPGTLSYCDTSAATLQTAATDEEIGSFVTIFRRLYMHKEPASFSSAVAVFARAMGDDPLAKWVKGVFGEYQGEMNETPHCFRFPGWENWQFSRKRLIDVFIYTLYAHQPDARRSRQFEECLQAVGGNRDLLTWLFLTVLWTCSVHMSNAGRIIAEFYELYCNRHKVTGAVISSVSRESIGIGTLEKREARCERILGEKAEELAKALWENDGCPEGGHARYLGVAREQLAEATSRQ